MTGRQTLRAPQLGLGEGREVDANPLTGVTDHAVVRFLERAYGLDVELIRRAIADATARGRRAAGIAGHERFDVVIGELRFAIKEGCVVTTTRKSRPRSCRYGKGGRR